MGTRKVELTELFRGSKSRNKVSVGEPAEGSLQILAVAVGNGENTVHWRPEMGESCVRCASGVSAGDALKSVGINIPTACWASQVLSHLWFFFYTFATCMILVCAYVETKLTTSDGGSLGSCIDEERSKLRYLV